MKEEHGFKERDIAQLTLVSIAAPGVLPAGTAQLIS